MSYRGRRWPYPVVLPKFIPPSGGKTTTGSGTVQGTTFVVASSVQSGSGGIQASATVIASSIVSATGNIDGNATVVASSIVSAEGTISSAASLLASSLVSATGNIDGNATLLASSLTTGSGTISATATANTGAIGAGGIGAAAALISSSIVAGESTIVASAIAAVTSNSLSASGIIRATASAVIVGGTPFPVLLTANIQRNVGTHGAAQRNAGTTGTVWSIITPNIEDSSQMQFIQGPKGSVLVSSGLNNNPAFQTGFDLPAGQFSIVGDGVTDNTTNINTALTYLNNNGGGTLSFAPGNYVYSGIINMSLFQNVTLKGPSSGNVTGSAAQTNLIFTGSGNVQPITIQSARGITFKNLGIISNNPSFNGTTAYLIDARQMAGHGNTTNITIEDCTLSYTALSSGGGPQALLALSDNTFAGAYSVDLNRVRFYGGNYGIVGRTGSAGFCNVVRISGCNFEFQNIAGILNPHLSWEICGGTIFEPLYLSGGVGAAGGIICNAPASSLEVHSCWFGDELSTAAGTWINFQGNGLNVHNCNIGCNSNTTGISIQGNVVGIAVHDNVFEGGGGSSKGIDFGSTTGNSGFYEFGNTYQSVTTPINGNIPNDAIYDAGGTLTLNNPTISGTLTALNITLNAVALLAVGTASPNLMTALQADFETSGYPTGWASNSGCTIATSTAAANHGSRCLAATSTINTAAVMSFRSGFNGGTSPIFQKTPVTSGGTYTALASFLCAPGTTPRLLQIKIFGYDINGNSITGTSGNLIISSTNNFSGPRDNTSTWTPVNISFTAAVPGSSTAVAYVEMEINWFDNNGVNFVIGEVHYVDTCQIAPGLNTLWSLPGASTTYITSTSMQPSLNRDFTLAGNGPVSKLYINPIGGGALGTAIGDGTQTVLTMLNGHAIASGPTPSIAAFTGAGTSGAPTVSVTGTDIRGQISVNASGIPATNSKIVTITFANSYASAPTIYLSPVNGNAEAIGAWEDSASRTASSFTLMSGSTPLAVGQTYLWDYLVIG